MNKSRLSEEDIKLQFITPAIERAGWDKHSQIKMEFPFTDGRIIVRGNITSRGNKKKADYILYYKSNLPLAVIEAKDNNHTVGQGMQQALEYAKILDIPFVYSSNGDTFLEHDRTTGHEKEIPLAMFPSPQQLWVRYKNHEQINNEQEKIISEPYHFQIGAYQPRYYQQIAINRTIKAIAQGQNRILIVMATGTGKTYTAFQIIYRLWKNGLKKKILYLADRNILIDQTMQQDFKPFEKIMTKIGDKKLDSAFEIYMSLYHQLAGKENNEPFRQFSPEFFDLIIIDECHRGSARAESLWRKILEYFSGATQIGMTATPKETVAISNIHYFGDPIYTYSLKQGIDDGFLAPYKVIRIGLNIDLEGYRPPKGTLDEDGEMIEDREYNIKDFDKNIIIDPRTKVVAKKITEYLRNTNRFDKTIVFCIDIEHAERMRQALVNENSDLVKENDKYIMRITGDNDIGKKQLENFQDVNEEYPTIVTTSKLMTTGCDCKTVKLIVLENNINSMTEFKQIIGRGTRLRPDCGKEYFTIMDFRNSSRLFADPAFDGDPVQIYEPGEDDPVVPPEDTGENEYPVTDIDNGNVVSEPEDTEGDPKQKKKKVRLRSGVEVFILSRRVQYYDKDGKLITESLVDYSRKNILSEYAGLDQFLQRWNGGMKKQAIIEELKNQGVLLDALREESEQYEMDDFDLICHLAFDKKPLTRAERINNVKKRDYLNKYEGLAREVIAALLEKYANEGIRELEDTEILELKPFRSMGITKIIKAFGGKEGLNNALKELHDQIYAA
jgi:type I restriction enzyme R subunit